MTQTEAQNTTFEEVLATRGTLVYANKGCSMEPLIKEGRDALLIERAEPAQIKKYDVVLFKREGQEQSREELEQSREGLGQSQSCALEQGQSSDAKSQPDVFDTASCSTTRYILHRVLKVKPGQQGLTYWVVGDNCTSGEEVAHEQILGVLTGLVRQGQELQLRGAGYWLYTRTWIAWWPLRFFILRSLRYIKRHAFLG